jgi:serine/threonine protein kinase
MAKPDSYAALPVGTVLGGSYRLVRKIAEGGMGTVYEARLLRLDRRCAVKVMSRELASSTEALTRFHREANISSQLAHPHIAQVTDFGTAASGEPFMVMEFLEGEDLARRLRRMGRLPAPLVGAIVKQTASALAATHARGIVHRDLKPANIFLVGLDDGDDDSTDFVKVVDFGISKIKGTALRLTRASVLMGTPSYMAPEQAMGKVDSIDGRTDQWALACIAWEMLTGEEPFTGADLTELLYRVVHADPVAPGGRAALAPEVEEVLRRALAKKQKLRFPNIAAFARAFADALAISAGLPLPARTGTGRRNAATGQTFFLRLASLPARLPRTIHRLRTMVPAPATLWHSLCTLHLRWPRRRRWWALALATSVVAAGLLWAGGVPLPTTSPALSTPPRNLPVVDVQRAPGQKAHQGPDRMPPRRTRGN